MARVLVVDDEEDLREFFVDALEGAGHAVSSAPDGAAALVALGRGRFDVLLTDLQMPRLDGEALARTARERWPGMAVVVLTAHGTVSNAVELMKLGVADFLEKPVESPAALREVIARAARRATTSSPTVGGEEEVRLTWGAPAMGPVEDALRRVAQTDATLLLAGESGTGKEVAARAVHRWSKRSGGPFVAVNCASLSDTLLESELFGHEKGAFTGATSLRQGRIEAAAKGTFFLDEIGDMKPELQARLLRVLQEREFTRVGGTRALPADVRWIAATHRNLAGEVEAGRFREDLYHRLAVFPVRMPSLRERPEDLVPLAEALLERIGRSLGRPGLRLGEGARAALVAHRWPGNVRELANTLERAAILSDGAELRSLGDAPRPAPSATSVAPPPMPSDAPPTMEQAERDAIVRALALCDGNRRRAAEHLGIGLRTLYDKLKRYGLG